MKILQNVSAICWILCSQSCDYEENYFLRHTPHIQQITDVSEDRTASVFMVEE